MDGHNAEAVRAAIEQARAVTDKPSLICCKTVIGWGSPNKQGKEECHGAALGVDEVALVRKTIGWEHAPFVVPDEIYAQWSAVDKGQSAEAQWLECFERYRAEHPDLAAEFERRMQGGLPEGWAAKAGEFIAGVDAKAEKVATRKASQNTLNGFGPLLPEIIGGSADLAGSNLTLWSGSTPISADDSQGNYIYFGVREFAMSAMINGIALHGGFVPYGATFLMFSEYARNAVRMAALMKIPSIFVYTHDSIGLGEDGPTHQAVEQTATLRMIPRMHVWRPCDAVESAVAWKAAIERRDGPSCLLFTRQGVPHQSRSAEQIAAIERGGYVLRECDGVPQAVLIATGSEVDLAMQAAQVLEDQGCRVRVVSMPSTNVFDAQDAAYREAVLPAGVTARVAIEAGVSDGWYKYVGASGRVVGIDSFGESAPAAEVFEHFGFNAGNVVRTVQEML